MVKRISLYVSMFAAGVAVFTAPVLRSMTYTSAIDDSTWTVQASVFECKLTHSVPFYGDAVFQTRAGEKSHFFLSAKSSRLASGKASLVFAPPLWRHDTQPSSYGHVTVNQGLKPISLNNRYTERMLSELNAGMDVVFTRAPWYGAENSSQVSITPIGFRSIYRDYLNCLAGLLPVNFDQIRRTAVYFSTGDFEELTKSERRKLDNIVMYAKADSRVKEFYIDGHTDKFGTRMDNMILSENRAKTISAYLVAQGLPESAISMRWHGERYPVSKNHHRKNRRVTIRLERSDKMKL